MKLKVIAVDLELSMRQRRALSLACIPVLLAALAGIAHAAPKVWMTGDTLNAGDLNALRVTVTAWQPFTPALHADATLVATSTENGNASTGYFRRVGDSVEVNADIFVPSCATPGTLWVGLPPGLLVDNAKTGAYTIIGSASVKNGSTGAVVRPVVHMPGATNNDSILMTVANVDGVNVTCNEVGSSGFLRLHFSAPILGWDVGN